MKLSMTSWALSLLMISSICWAKDVGPMTPLPSERLPKKLNFTKECFSVAVVEWRTDNKRQSEPSEKTSKVLDDICQVTIKSFPKFIAERTSYQLQANNNFSVNISLMPNNSNYRNLNDTEFRFFNRSKEYDSDGNVIPILGYYQRSTEHIYIYNQLNSKFRIVFAHELFHALSYQHGIYHQHANNKDETEELLAQEFTSWLGWGA